MRRNTKTRGGPARRRGLAAIGAALLMYMAHAASAAPAGAAEVLEASDHAELAARVAASGVSRIALVNDRIVRVVRTPGGFEVEHDPARGDLYLRPLAGGTAEASAPDAEPEALFIGTERGFTYRLTLMPVDGGAAQILIRNAQAAAAKAGADAGDARIAGLVRLVRAVARREPLPGYAVEAQAGRSVAGLDLIETWRGSRFAALVVALGADPGTGPGQAPDAAALAARLGPGVAAAWVSPASGIGVAVREGTHAPAPGHVGEVR